MRVGVVCPYSLTLPGGVQGQVLGLGRSLRAMGVDARVLAPCDGPPPDAAVTPSSPGPAADPLERSLVERTRGGLDLRARQRAALESYGWVDRDAGVARIPIDRAIDLTVERAP